MNTIISILRRLLAAVALLALLPVNLIIAALLPLTRWLRGGKRTVFVNGQQKG